MVELLSTVCEPERQNAEEEGEAAQRSRAMLPADPLDEDRRLHTEGVVTTALLLSVGLAGSGWYAMNAYQSGRAAAQDSATFRITDLVGVPGGAPVHEVFVLTHMTNATTDEVRAFSQTGNLELSAGERLPFGVFYNAAKSTAQAQTWVGYGTQKLANFLDRKTDAQKEDEAAAWKAHEEDHIRRTEAKNRDFRKTVEEFIKQNPHVMTQEKFDKMAPEDQRLFAALFTANYYHGKVMDPDKLMDPDGNLTPFWRDVVAAIDSVTSGKSRTEMYTELARLFLAHWGEQYLSSAEYTAQLTGTKPGIMWQAVRYFLLPMVQSPDTKAMYDRIAKIWYLQSKLDVDVRLSRNVLTAGPMVAGKTAFNVAWALFRQKSVPEAMISETLIAAEAMYDFMSIATEWVKWALTHPLYGLGLSLSLLGSAVVVHKTANKLGPLAVWTIVTNSLSTFVGPFAVTLGTITVGSFFAVDWTIYYGLVGTAWVGANIFDATKWFYTNRANPRKALSKKMRRLMRRISFKTLPRFLLATVPKHLLMSAARTAWRKVRLGLALTDDTTTKLLERYKREDDQERAQAQQKRAEEDARDAREEEEWERREQEREEREEWEEHVRNWEQEQRDESATSISFYANMVPAAEADRMDVATEVSKEFALLTMIGRSFTIERAASKGVAATSTVTVHLEQGSTVANPGGIAGIGIEAADAAARTLHDTEGYVLGLAAESIRSCMAVVKQRWQSSQSTTPETNPQALALPSAGEVVGRTMEFLRDVAEVLVSCRRVEKAVTSASTTISALFAEDKNKRALVRVKCFVASLVGRISSVLLRGTGDVESATGFIYKDLTDLMGLRINTGANIAQVMEEATKAIGDMPAPKFKSPAEELADVLRVFAVSYVPMRVVLKPGAVKTLNGRIVKSFRDIDARRAKWDQLHAQIAASEAVKRNTFLDGINFHYAKLLHQADLREIITYGENMYTLADALFERKKGGEEVDFESDWGQLAKFVDAKLSHHTIRFATEWSGLMQSKIHSSVHYYLAKVAEALFSVASDDKTHSEDVRKTVAACMDLATCEWAEDLLDLGSPSGGGSAQQRPSAQSPLAEQMAILRAAIASKETAGAIKGKVLPVVKNVLHGASDYILLAHGAHRMSTVSYGASMGVTSEPLLAESSVLARFVRFKDLLESVVRTHNSIARANVGDLWDASHEDAKRTAVQVLVHASTRIPESYMALEFAQVLPTLSEAWAGKLCLSKFINEYALMDVRDHLNESIARSKTLLPLHRTMLSQLHELRGVRLDKMLTEHDIAIDALRMSALADAKKAGEPLEMLVDKKNVVYGRVKDLFVACSHRISRDRDRLRDVLVAAHNGLLKRCRARSGADASWLALFGAKESSRDSVWDRMRSLWGSKNRKGTDAPSADWGAWLALASAYAELDNITDLSQVMYIVQLLCSRVTASVVVRLAKDGDSRKQHAADVDPAALDRYVESVTSMRDHFVSTLLSHKLYAAGGEVAGPPRPVPADALGDNDALVAMQQFVHELLKVQYDRGSGNSGRIIFAKIAETYVKDAIKMFPASIKTGQRLFLEESLLISSIDTLKDMNNYAKGTKVVAPAQQQSPGTSFTAPPSVRSGTAPPSVRSGTAPPSVRSGTAPPSVRSGTAPPSVRSGTTPPSVRSGTTPPPIRSGTAPPPIRSGTAPPSVRSGTAPPSVGSGTAPPSVRSGTAPPSVRSGTAPPPIRSGTAPPSVRSGTAPPSVRSGTASPPIRSGTAPPSVRSGTAPPPIRSGTVPPPRKI
jgi:hypothetical protein